MFQNGFAIGWMVGQNRKTYIVHRVLNMKRLLQNSLLLEKIDDFCAKWSFAKAS